MFKDGQAYLGLARLAVIKQSGLLPVLLSALWLYGIAVAVLADMARSIYVRRMVISFFLQ